MKIFSSSNFIRRKTWSSHSKTRNRTEITQRFCIEGISLIHCRRLIPLFSYRGQRTHTYIRLWWYFIDINVSSDSGRYSRERGRLTLTLGKFKVQMSGFVNAFTCCLCATFVETRNLNEDCNCDTNRMHSHNVSIKWAIYTHTATPTGSINTNKGTRT